MGGREGALIRGGHLFLNFGRQEGRLFEGGAYSKGGGWGGANSRIYCIAKLTMLSSDIHRLNKVESG